MPGGGVVGPCRGTRPLQVQCLPVQASTGAGKFNRLSGMTFASTAGRETHSKEGASMRIAQVAPLYESVPPKNYGGTERVVSYLTEELVRQGHDVTLFASGDSETTARLVPCSKQSLRTDAGCIDQLACHILMLEEVFRQAKSFDVIHFHVDY